MALRINLPSQLPPPDFSMLKPGSAATKALIGSAFAGPASGGSVAPLGASSGGGNSSAPAIQLSGAYTPDYNSLINNDPSLVAFRGNEAQSIADAGTARQQAIRSLAVQYGGLPQGVNDLYGDIDQTTQDLAKNNQYSDTANLTKNYNDTVLGIKRSLAARGALQSGDLNYGLDQANTAKGQQSYTLGNNFSNALQMALNNYTGGVNSIKQQEADAIRQAGQNVYANPAYRPGDAVMANYLGGSFEKYGQAVYQGADGKLYGADGSSFDGGGGGDGGGDRDQPSAPAQPAPINLGSLGSFSAPPTQAPVLHPGQNPFGLNEPNPFAIPPAAQPPSNQYGNQAQRRRQMA